MGQSFKRIVRRLCRRCRIVTNHVANSQGRTCERCNLFTAKTRDEQAALKAAEVRA